MRPNFKKLSKNYEEIGLKALRTLIGKQSVYDEKTIAPNAPYGAGVKSALDYVASLGEDYGFHVDTCHGHCTELTFGEEGPLIGVYAHSDVVPVSGKWSEKPFAAKIVGEGKEAKIIGRGSTDDKGPLIASLMAIKLLKDNGLIKGFRVRLVAGGDEERGSSCLRYFFEKLNKKPSDYGFTPDAEFPLIYAEKGIHHATAKGKLDLKPIIAMDGGVVTNAVCDRLVVTLHTDKRLDEKLKAFGVKYDLVESGPIQIVTFFGKSAHGSTPELGENAALTAFRVLGSIFGIVPLFNLSKVLADPFGTGFGGDCYSEGFGESGKSTFNYGIIRYKDGVLSVTVDYRYGEKAKPEVALAAFEKATGLTVEVGSVAPILYFDKKSPLVSTLMKSYRHMTLHLFDKPMAIGGGTYAKEVKNCVAYGGAFPEHQGNIHSPDEYLYLDDFRKSIAIYADAIYALGQLRK
ncbi:MAG: Sapep family Mn(2+)-dependent dipeptidase [Bacilli bacterium]|nr:Sapep family Mn(2+)-dependent dipeptidase [Bacilli bacterium]